MRPPSRRRVAEIFDRRVLWIIEQPEPGPSEVGESLGRLGGKRQRPDCAVRAGSGAAAVRGFLEYTCPLVPPMPKELTAAQRGAFGAGERCQRRSESAAVSGRARYAD